MDEDIKKMSKGEKIMWIVLETLGAGSVALTQISTVVGLETPAIIGAVLIAMTNTARYFQKRFFPNLFQKKVQ